MACDICGKSNKPLKDIKDIYRTETIQQICPDCMQFVNAKLSDIQTLVFKKQCGWLKEFMQSMKDKLTTQQKQ